MIETLFQFGISNTVIAAAFAVIAFLVSRFGKYPHLAYLLWLLVLVKLVTPPVVSIPGVDWSQIFAVDAERTGSTGIEIAHASPADIAIIPEENVEPVPVTVPDDVQERSFVTAWFQGVSIQGMLFALILLGSFAILIWTLLQAFRFHRVLLRETLSTPPEIETMANRLAQVIGFEESP